MGRTHSELTQNLAERLCWEGARRDDARVARRLYCKQLVDGVYRLNSALPSLLFSDETLMQLVGFNAQQIRQGIRQRGGTTRQGAWLPGPIFPDTLATNIVKAPASHLQNARRVFG